MKRKYFLFARYGLFCLFAAVFFAVGRESTRLNQWALKKKFVQLLQENHRFYDVDPKDRDALVRKDREKRILAMSSYNRSLARYAHMISDTVLSQLVETAANARVLSIYEADTMGVSMVRGDRLSVIPLTNDEYLLYDGRRDQSYGYYDPNCRMIVLYLDHMPIQMDEAYSINSAKLYIHELLHDYLSERNGKYDDIDAQHKTIAHMQSVFFGKLIKQNGPSYARMFMEDVYCEMLPPVHRDKPSGEEDARHFDPALHEEELLLNVLRMA